jgi:hypothetical protein
MAAVLPLLVFLGIRQEIHVTSGTKERSDAVQAAFEDSVRAQLDRILASQPFRASERFPRFLKYVVEAVLQSSPGTLRENPVRESPLRERTIGVEVFGRAPGYDTATDNIVRSTAGEVRKRLAVYYEDPKHRTELRIVVPSGSYLPEFSLADSTAPNPDRATDKGIDPFWQPVLSSHQTVLVVVGEPPPEAFAARLGPPRETNASPNPFMHIIGLPDATALMRLGGLLQAHRKDYRVGNEGVTAFGDLRSGPALLIGAFNNRWTMRLTSALRFHFQEDADTRKSFIGDCENPGRKWMQTWRPGSEPDGDNSSARDYAIVARVLDPSIGQMSVVAAGLTLFGTLAAGEFLTTSSCLDELVRHAPPGWETGNVEVVIATHVIDGVSGPPHIEASHFW